MAAVVATAYLTVERPWAIRAMQQPRYGKWQGQQLEYGGGVGSDGACIHQCSVAVSGRSKDRGRYCRCISRGLEYGVNGLAI